MGNVKIASEKWLEFDVTSAVQGFIKNSSNNYGFIIHSVIERQRAWVASSEYSDESLRPKLTIEYGADTTPIINNGNKSLKSSGIHIRNEIGAVNIFLPFNGMCEISILNMNGRQVYKSNSVSNSGWIKIPVKLSQGMHILHVKLPGNTFIKNFHTVN